MSDYTIPLKAGILDSKHRKAMGEALWLYVWFIDKMTKIDQESGVGKVWNTKPIKYSDVAEPLGISRATYLRWLKALTDGGYVETTRTPNGLQIRITKAFKYFGNTQKGSIKNDTSHGGVMLQKRYSDVAYMTQGSSRSATSNIRQYTDNTKTMGKFVEKQETRSTESEAKERIRALLKAGDLKKLKGVKNG